MTEIHCLNYFSTFTHRPPSCSNTEAEDIQQQGWVPGLLLKKDEPLILPETMKDLNYYKSIYICGMKLKEIKTLS